MRRALGIFLFSRKNLVILLQISARVKVFWVKKHISKKANLHFETRGSWQLALTT